ncbi:MAG: TspO/MBR family protein [Pseudomonadota bacterium]
MNDYLALGLFLAANFAAASSGAVFRPGDWYDALSKPAWTPPDWLFPVAWSVLYVMIAAAGWLIWREAGWTAPALALYALQLVLNAVWSALFFGLRRPGWALIEVSVLWAAIVATIWAFYPISPLAAALMAPYAVWVTFAAVLNAEIVRRNPQAHALSP